ncbi:MAG TPA: HAD family hydrolase [Candidatus Bathyarchaeia archaeon]
MNIAVLFDLEDTLVQTPWADHQHVLEFRRKTREELLSLGIPSSVLEGIERSAMMRNKALEYLEQDSNGTEVERFKAHLEEFLSQYELESANRSKLFPDTIPSLETLRKLEVKMGLVISTSTKAVETIFQRHRLAGYFKAVVTREHVKRLKPDPESILLAVKQLGVKHFLMVGDLALDIVAAKSAEGTAVLVDRYPENSDSQYLFKGLPPEILEIAEKCADKNGFLRADYVVKSLLEVPQIVEVEMTKT